ncbi:hypothetical protein PG984_014224 [Apiospora sp. TS-2023a]
MCSCLAIAGLVWWLVDQQGKNTLLEEQMNQEAKRYELQDKHTQEPHDHERLLSQRQDNQKDDYQVDVGDIPSMHQLSGHTDALELLWASTYAFKFSEHIRFWRFDDPGPPEICPKPLHGYQSELIEPFTPAKPGILGHSTALRHYNTRVNLFEPNPPIP